MRLLALVVFCTLIVGCGTNPELGKKTEVLKPDEPPAAKFPVLDKPASSDPEAQAIAAKIVAAHTGNQPGMLERMKSCNFGREGKFNGVTNIVPVQFQLKSVWPNRARYLWTGMEAYPFAIRIFDKQIIKDEPSKQQSFPIPDKYHDGFFRHFCSDLYQLLIPFTDKNLTVAKGPDFKQSDKTLPSIRIWLPDWPQAIFYYDPATFRVERIAYDGRENAAPTYIELSLSDFRTTNGFLLAHHLFVRMNGREFMEFEKATLEFPIEHPAKLFTDP